MKKTMNTINRMKEIIDTIGYDYFCYIASGYVAECVDIVIKDDFYVVHTYTSAESNDGDLEEVFRSEDFNEVIKFLYEEGYFDEESCDISKEEVEEYLKGNAER